MNAKKWISLLICFVMVFTCITPAFASTGSTAVLTSDETVWTPADFTYDEYEKLLYGCDYTREIVIEGLAITGFSESGEAKLANNKDLVIPATTPDGELIVGIGQSAFANKGLTSVEFPTGMMVGYDDTITQKVTKRGNFIIAESAFAGNELTSVTLPEGVIAVLPHAFNNNKLETVKLPRTIWWLETMSFANNRLTTVDFPTTCDFQLEMHGMAFAKNFIKAVRLPDFTEVVNKEVFFLNLGMEPIVSAPNDAYKTYEVDGVTYDAGIVYMYADNSELEAKDRIHHADKATASQKSYVQKLIINDGTQTHNENAWNINDFTVEGTIITGLSESGIAKRKVNKDLVIPEITEDYRYVTEIAAGTPGGCGLFATEDEKFDSVYLPMGLKKIGEYAFQNSGLKDITFPWTLTTVGTVAFQSNELTSVILPDTVTDLGTGAFATNPKLERISLSKALTSIPEAAFGCSDNKNYMTNLKSIELHEGITEIGVRAFAGNNFAKIETPSTLEKIGDYAFSTKNYLTTPCEVVLNEGLTEIGARAFRNKVIDKITLPKSVTQIGDNTFEKAYSDDTDVVITKVLVQTQSQFEDKENFPESDYHKIYFIGDSMWTAEDFTYGTETFSISPVGESDKAVEVVANVITGFSESGTEKFDLYKSVVLPEEDKDGNKVQGVGTEAFKGLAIEQLELPENITADYDDSTWATTGKGITARGDFFIGASAFEGTSLTKITLPEGVIHIGEKAFEGSNLVSVDLPKSVMVIGQRAFADNSIFEVGFANQTDFALQIEDEAFAVNKIKTVQLPANTEKVEKWAFVKNPGMETVTTDVEAEADSGLVYMYMEIEDISRAATLISHNANETNPSNVQKLVAGETPDMTATWTAEDFIYNEATGTLLGWSELGKNKRLVNKELVLPDKTPEGADIVAIGKAAFKIPNDEVEVTKFGVDSPNGMTSVVLPEKVKTIGAEAFSQNALTQVDLSTVTAIGARAFYGNDLVKVELPDTVTSLGEGAFATNDITELRLSASVTRIPQGAFSMNIRMEQVTIPETVTEIGTTAFAGARLTSLTIPKSVTKIGEKAFHLHHLSELTIPGNVKELGESAFEGTFKATTLKKLVIEEGVEIIGNRCFKEALLETVHFPNSLKTIGTEIFLNNKGLNGSGVVEVTTFNRGLEGTEDTTFVIKQLSSSLKEYEQDITLSFSQAIYTGKEIKPVVTVKNLEEGKDFEVIYTNNVEVGNGVVIISGLGNYEGIVIKNFTISKLSLSGYNAKLSATSYTYDGSAKTPTVTIAGLVKDKDYTVAYSKNTNAGTAKVTITGKGSYEGTITKNFTIATQSASKCKAELSATAYTYNGKTKTPSVTVYNAQGKKLSKGTDYDVKYASGRKKIDKYKVAVTFKGNYSGSKNLYFTIGPKNPKSVKTALYGYDDVKVSWSKVSGASGYVVYYKKASASSYTKLKTTTSTSYKKSNLSDGVKYTFKVVAYKTAGGDKCYNAGKTSSITTLKKITGVKAKKSSSKVKISWTNIGGETGYQISQSTSKSKTKVVATYKTTSGKSKTISATKGKTYYYKVRAYKTVGDKKIYGPWSSVVKYKR